MTNPFSMRGELDRWPYLAMAVPAILSQHLLAALVLGDSAAQALGRPLFWVSPFRTVFWGEPFGSTPSLQPAVLLGLLIFLVADAWLLAALSLRRARGGGANLGLATLAIVPGLQFAVVLLLALAPGFSRPNAGELAQAALPDGTPSPGKPDVVGRVQGLLAGMALCVLAVGLSTLVMRTYGFALFLASPAVIGITVGFIANRRAALTGGQTARLVLSALLLGGLALVGVAFEGVICLVMAAPLIAVMGLIGGAIGRAMAGDGTAGRNGAGMAIIILPLLIMGERAAPPHAGFEDARSIEIDAPPAAVWDSVVHMGPIPDAPAAPFRWGLAYPLRGRITGEGVGAIREGVFSTGIAYERVTEWEPGRKLSFIVLSDPPTMRELSPYERIDAPHTRSYFRTADARFTLTPLPNGRTRLTLATHHDLDLEPAPYWIPLARWAVRANKARVLAHFKAQAEGRPG